MGAVAAAEPVAEAEGGVEGEEEGGEVEGDGRVSDANRAGGGGVGEAGEGAAAGAGGPLPGGAALCDGGGGEGDVGEVQAVVEGAEEVVADGANVEEAVVQLDFGGVGGAVGVEGDLVPGEVGVVPEAAEPEGGGGESEEEGDGEEEVARLGEAARRGMGGV